MALQLTIFNQVITHVPSYEGTYYSYVVHRQDHGHANSGWGGSAADGRHGGGEGGAKTQEQGRAETVEKPFEIRERHDTHLEFDCV